MHSQEAPLVLLLVAGGELLARGAVGAVALRLNAAVVAGLVALEAARVAALEEQSQASADALAAAEARAEAAEARAEAAEAKAHAEAEAKARAEAAVAKALWDAAQNGNTDAVRGYIAKGVNVNWKNPDHVRAPPPPRAHHGERGPSPPRPPPRGARARPGNGEFCDSRAPSKGGVSATTRRSRRSRCRRNSFFAISGPPERRAGARSEERSPRLSGARAGARAPFPPFARARDAAAKATGCERGSSAEERNRV